MYYLFYFLILLLLLKLVPFGLEQHYILIFYSTSKGLKKADNFYSKNTTFSQYKLISSSSRDEDFFCDIVKKIGICGSA